MLTNTQLFDRIITKRASQLKSTDNNEQVTKFHQTSEQQRQEH